MTVKILLAPTVTELIGYLARIPESDGVKNLIFCEDRLTLEAERAIASEKKATFLTSVTTFARFLSGYSRRKTLSKQGSVLAVGGIASKRADTLRCFSKNPAGAASRLYETIAQLRAALVTPEMLEAAAAETQGMLSDKLKDIALIYRDYLDFLSGGLLDESGVLELLPEAMEKSGKIKGANVYFAGFSSFTKQAAAGIFTAIRCARSVTAVFLGGEEEIYTQEAADTFEKYAKAAGAKVEREFLPPVLSSESEKLRRSLFDAEKLSEPPLKTSSVHIYEGADAEDELSFIAAMIRRETTGRGMRYRDIALLLSDVQDYAVPLAKIFGEYKIPYFSDVKKSIAAHPVCRFAVSWLNVLAGGFAPEDVDSFVANPFFCPSDGQRDIYRNYLIRFGNYRGGVKRPIAESAFIESNKKRDEEEDKKAKDQFSFCKNLQAMLLSAFDGISDRAAVGNYCRAIRKMLELFGAQEREQELAEKLKTQGFAEESAFLSHGLENCLRVLDEAESLAASSVMRAEEFSALLSESFTSLKISLIPQTVDAVFVGDLAESKKTAAKVLFAGRLTSDVPLTGSDTALVSDRDIDKLRSLKVEIEPKIREVNARTRESTALNLCGFSQRLYLSYPMSLAGKESKRSEIIDSVRALFREKNGGEKGILTRAALERSERYDEGAYRRYLACVAGEKIPALRELLVRADAYRRGRSTFSAHSGLFAALKEAGEDVSSLLFGKEEKKDFIPEAAAVLFKGKNTVSPTLVEGYFACPYFNFASRGLALRERREGSVQVTDTGDFMHEIFCSLAKNMENLQDERACEEYLMRLAKDLSEKPPYIYLTDTAEGGFTSDALIREAVIVGRNVYDQLKNSEFSVFAAEQSFGYPNSLFGGGVSLSGKTPLFLAGKIDRVDRSGDYTRVVDYKTGKFDVSAESYYTGRKMQLELYLYAASRGGRMAGAYYFPAKLSFGSVEDDSPFRMQGFTLGDDNVIALSEKGIEAGNKSKYIDAVYGKKSRKALPQEDFEPFIEYSVLAARQCVKETLDGCIAASPYTGVCTYCPYGGLCGSDGKNAREEKQVDFAEISAIVKRRKGL